jgi:hypothetical protein
MAWYLVKHKENLPLPLPLPLLQHDTKQAKTSGGRLPFRRHFTADDKNDQLFKSTVTHAYRKRRLKWVATLPLGDYKYRGLVLRSGDWAWG